MRLWQLIPILGAALALCGCGTAVTALAPNAGAAAVADTSDASRSGLPILPDPSLTPGATLPVTASDVCTSGYAHAVRNVPIDVKRQVYAEYGIASRRPGDFEIDHLISLELGGSNSIKNLWPQSFRTRPWNARVKDQLEDKLHEMVCGNQIDLATAQQEIAKNWIESYRNRFHTNVPKVYIDKNSAGSSRRPHARRRERTQATDDVVPPGRSLSTGAQSPSGDVWVNTRSGKYFYAGSEYYGRTKQGRYMSEADARAQGYAAARGPQTMR